MKISMCPARRQQRPVLEEAFAFDVLVDPNWAQASIMDLADDIPCAETLEKELAELGARNTKL